MLTICLFLLLFGVQPAVAQSPRSHYLPEDSIAIEKLLASQRQDVLYYARKFLGCPYVAHTLELYPDDERLVLNTRELDCTTYVDVVAALTLCARRGETTFGQFLRQLQQQRYWNGVCDGYASRIHYFSDWIRDNTRLGFATELQQPDPPFTAVQTVSVSYMTTHPDAYVSLKRHPEYIPKIDKQEKNLTGCKFRYIPTEQVADTKTMRQSVHDGDIVCIVTAASGLDIAHLGIAVWHDDGLYRIDASSIHKKVVEEPAPLRTYLEKRSQAKGIRVVRLCNEP